MPTFTIDDENNITLVDSAELAASSGHSTSFDSQASLAKISGDWPLSRFVNVWNSIPGQAEVQRFADRNKAVARIWRAIQPLGRNSQPTRRKPTSPVKQLAVPKCRPRANGRRPANITPNVLMAARKPW